MVAELRREPLTAMQRCWRIDRHCLFTIIEARSMKRIDCAQRLWLTSAVSCLVATAAVPGSARSQSAPSLADRIQHVVDRPEFRHALFGIEFYDLDSGKPVYTLNADKLFVPGSTTKLFTMGTALELLGPDYRFHTRVYRTGPITADGTLQGDVVLVASGDPNLSARVRPDGTLAFENEDHAYDGDPSTRAVPGDPLIIIREIARQIAAHGVKRVRGRVLVDATLFASGDRELGTGTVISPIVVNDNLVDMMIGPGASAGAPATLSVSPATSYVRFVNHVVTGTAAAKRALDIKGDTTDADGMHTVTLTGTMPAGAPSILYSYAVASPARFAEVALAQALGDDQIAVESSDSAAADFRTLAASYTPDRVVAEYVSLPYSQEIKVTLKVSQNLHASLTPRMLRAVLAPHDTSRTGFDLEHDFLTRAGLDLTGAQQADGAGGDAHFTPDFVVNYLKYMSQQKNFNYFYSALPVLGRDGTLWNIQQSSPAAGHVHAKTGTFEVDDPLNHRLLVTGKGLAGYMTTASGRHLAFAVYVNNVSVAPDAAAVNAIGDALGEIAAAAYAGP
jgi:D-alanyl-D-alanine carboxypeptidase/D-alanyl-D-alanine-endopeptidase (penicillin-binding protein 4)